MTAASNLNTFAGVMVLAAPDGNFSTVASPLPTPVKVDSLSFVPTEEVQRPQTLSDAIELAKRKRKAFVKTMAPLNVPSPTSLGRRGDPRMHRAMVARLANPHMTLLDALLVGGFEFPDLDKLGKADRTIRDADNVLLSQRKNQLSRRLRKERRRQEAQETTAAPAQIVSYPMEMPSPAAVSPIKQEEAVVGGMITQRLMNGMGAHTVQTNSPEQSPAPKRMSQLAQSLMDELLTHSESSQRNMESTTVAASDDNTNAAATWTTTDHDHLILQQALQDPCFIQEQDHQQPEQHQPVQITIQPQAVPTYFQQIAVSGDHVNGGTVVPLIFTTPNNPLAPNTSVATEGVLEPLCQGTGEPDSVISL